MFMFVNDSTMTLTGHSNGIAAKLKIKDLRNLRKQLFQSPLPSLTRSIVWRKFEHDLCNGQCC
jgi:hypothetical protein